MKNRMISAIQLTYEAIAGDLGDVDLNDAVECTLDADRVAMYGMDENAYLALKALNWEEMERLGKEALRSYF